MAMFWFDQFSFAKGILNGLSGLRGFCPPMFFCKGKAFFSILGIGACASLPLFFSKLGISSPTNSIAYSFSFVTLFFMCFAPLSCFFDCLLSVPIVKTLAAFLRLNVIFIFHRGTIYMDGNEKSRRVCYESFA